MSHNDEYWKLMFIDLGKWGRKSKYWTIVATTHPDIYGKVGSRRTRNKKAGIKDLLGEYIKTGQISYSLQIYFDHISEESMRDAIYEEDHGDLEEYKEYYDEPSKHPEYVKMTNHCKAVSFLTELSSIIVEEMDVDVSSFKRKYDKIKLKICRNEFNLSKYAELVKLEIDDNVEYKSGDDICSGRKVDNTLERAGIRGYYIYLHTPMGIRKININTVRL